MYGNYMIYDGYDEKFYELLSVNACFAQGPSGTLYLTDDGFVEVTEIFGSSLPPEYLFRNEELGLVPSYRVVDNDDFALLDDGTNLIQEGESRYKSSIDGSLWAPIFGCYEDSTEVDFLGVTMIKYQKPRLVK